MLGWMASSSISEILSYLISIRVSLSSQERMAEEGATSRQGVKFSGLGVSTVKMNKQGGFQATPQLPVGRGPYHEGSVHGV